MSKFRKKPVVIEAILASEVLDGSSSGRFAEGTLRNGETLITQWIIDAFTNGTIGFESQSGKECVVINTLEGQMRAERGDWIIRGVKGELYPCKPDIFAATYDAYKDTFEAGDVVFAKGLPMTIENVASYIPGKGIGVRCVWFGEDGKLHRDVFDPKRLEHTNERTDFSNAPAAPTRG